MKSITIPGKVPILASHNAYAKMPDSTAAAVAGTAQAKHHSFGIACAIALA